MRDTEALPQEVLPSTSSSAVCSPSKRRCAKSLLRTAHSLAPPLLARVWHPSADQEGVVQAHRVHRARVPDLAVAVGPVMGPQLNPKPAQVRDQSTREQHQMEVLKSSLEMRPVGVRMMSQGSMSLLDVSTIDDDTRKCKAHELASKSDTDFVAWKDKLIREGVTGIQERDSMVNDYADSGKRRPKNPDPLGPPISYMKECRVFQPLPSMMKPMGLCCFYPTDPVSVSMLAPPKSLAMAEHLKGLLLLTKMQCWPYIIIVFQGGPITPLGLLQELHMWNALDHIPIFQSDETKDGHRPHVSCCPFCTYTIQNDPTYLNHIVGMHYHANFTCGTCLNAVTVSVNR